MTITANIGDMSYESAVNKIKNGLKTVDFPEEYNYEFDETIEKIKDNKRTMAVSILLAVVFIYMILASLFESFTIPFIIVTTVPLAIIGVIIILFVTGSTLNISVYIGLIVLCGIVVNNGIILVDSINTGYRNGVLDKPDINSAIKAHCVNRFRPVIITTLTTALGLVPMLIKAGEGSNLWRPPVVITTLATALGLVPMLIKAGEGSNLWRPLSLTLISGLLFSTVLTLIIMPVLCSYLFRIKLRKSLPAAEA